VVTAKEIFNTPLVQYFCALNMIKVKSDCREQVGQHC